MLLLLAAAVHLTLPNTRMQSLFPDLRAAAARLKPKPARESALLSIDNLERATSAGSIESLGLTAPAATPEQGRRQRDLRVKFADVLDAFQDTAYEARVMELAAAVGAFRTLYQYPACFNTRIRSSRPVFQEADYPQLARAVRALEAASGAIAAEYASTPPAMHVTNVENLVEYAHHGGGGWTTVQLYVAGACLREHKFPVTCAALRTVARELGTVTATATANANANANATAVEPLPRLMAARFNRMGARVRVVPHLSQSNQRLKLHLGVRVPRGIELRIANRTARWREGKVLVIDDSFRHSISGENDEPRVVLEVEIRHPDLIDGNAPYLGPVDGACFVQVRANGTVPVLVAQGMPNTVDESAGKFRACRAELHRRCVQRLQASPSAKACRQCALLNMEALATAGCTVDLAVAACEQLLLEVEAERSDERDNDEDYEL